MAEATDRPQGTAEATSTPANAVGERVAAPEDGISLGVPQTAETYRPLSLLALAGFAVAVLYAALVGVGGAIALFNRAPWLLPTWVFLVPLAALILCWLARSRIRDSEGTLSGLAFTTWGVRLAAIAGVLYGFYYAFTFFAVRLQAIDCADQFFAQLQQDRPQRAFLLAVGEAPRDMEESEVRNMVEARFNSPASQAGTGAYDQFRRTSFVRAIQMAGGQANIIPAGVTDWSYAQGGYRVVLKYHISTALVEFDMNVETFGQDSQPGESRGRQWHVRLSKGETNILPSTMKSTAAGEEYMNTARMAWNFASVWQERINRLAWGEAYLDTLEPSQRTRLLEAGRAMRLRATAPLAGPAALGLYEKDGRDLRDFQDELAQSPLIRLDEKRLWTNKQQRADIEDRIKKTFQLGSAGAPTFSLRVQQAEMPMLREADGRMHASFDARLTYIEPDTMRSKYIVDGQLVVSAPVTEAGSSPAVWRVDALEPESGRTSPLMERARQAAASGMGGPGMGGPAGGP